MFINKIQYNKEVSYPQIGGRVNAVPNQTLKKVFEKLDS